MKNNIIKIVLIIIISLNLFQYSFADDFDFNVTEIQVSNNGNIIKGFNGGTVTSSNDIIITADIFEYNKITKLLKVEGNVKIIDSNEKLIIESNKAFYEKDKEKIYTTGKSKASNSTNIIILADESFTYNRLTTLLEAKGNVLVDDKEREITIETEKFFYLKNEERFFTEGKTKVFIEKKYILDTKNLVFLPNQNLLFSEEKTTMDDSMRSNIYKLIDFKYLTDKEILKGSKVKILTSNKKSDRDIFFFENAFFNLKKNTFLAKDTKAKFHKTIFDNDKNDPRINSVATYGDELNTYFDKAVFTSCKKTDKCPPWKIRSEKIHHNKAKQQIIYKNAWLDLYNFPVLYFPKFFHPDPTVKKQSGFLQPDISTSENLGSSIYAPYFYIISNNKDITIKPRLFDDNKFVLQSEYRVKNEKSYTIADFSLARGHNSSIDDKNDTRSHFFSETTIDLSLEKFNRSILKLNFEKTSNDNYLKLFDLQSPLLLQNNDVLETAIKLDLQNDDYNLITSVEMYETLGGLNSDRYEYVLPSYNFSKNLNSKKFKGDLNFYSSGSNNLNATNVITSELLNDLNYTTENIFFDNGIKSNFKVLLKNTNVAGKNNLKYKSKAQSDIMSAYIYNVSLPLTKSNKKSHNTLEPKLSFRLSPHDMNNNSSLGRRIDNNNIFNDSRLSMNDAHESGESITLGFNYKKEKIFVKNKISEIENYIDFKLATVFRLDEEKNIPVNSTLNKKNSNIFGQLKFNPFKNIFLDYNFSLTSDLNTLEYNSITTNFEFNNFTSQFDFLEERGAIGTTNLISNSTKYKFNEENSLSFKTRRNRNLNLTEYYDLVYEYKNDCLIAGLKYKKNYYQDADIQPMEELFFSITIVPLTTFSPDRMVLK
jgi:LPS-assembly protein